MADCVIFHYEDEPEHIVLPSMIEVALYQHADVTRSSIEELRCPQDYRISYSVAGQDHSLRYVLEVSIDAACARAECQVGDVLLNLVDRFISGDGEAGIKIVAALQERGVPNDRIWMLTAYEVQLRRVLRDSGITIYQKQGATSEMVLRILAMLPGIG